MNPNTLTLALPGVLILAAGLALGAHPVVAALPLLALFALVLRGAVGPQWRSEPAPEPRRERAHAGD